MTVPPADSAERANLRARGRALRIRLGIGDDVHGAPAPGYPDLSDELFFGAIWCREGLPLTDRMVATLAALGARQRQRLIPAYCQAALRLGLGPDAIRETFIQAGLYAGFPTAEDALRLAAEVFEAQGMASPAKAAPLPDSLAALGAAKMSELHGERSTQGYAAPDHPTSGELYKLAIRYGYGVLWNRPGLSRRQRFICSVAAFTALELDSQLRKFAQSAENNDLQRAEVIEVIMQTAPYAGFPPALNALSLLGADV
ncbi:MAG: carboxymuconolactone decarboxylase family protein [Gammaproteobacteria bacterium]|nr:carboxymuconolactone decarboxylase family protein [Gammaproteobacteria bacterium]